MRAVCIRYANPFRPLEGREVAVLRRPVRVRRLAPRGRPAVAVLNGRPLLRAGWRRRLRDGDHLVFVPVVGGEGSDPLRLILSLALIAFAPWAAGALLGSQIAGTALIGTFTIGQATALGIVLAGSALIDALLPVQQPGSLPAPSPTYSLQAQGNAARIDAPIPVQYGRLRVFPDFAAQPYTEFAGGEQYLYQLLCLGAGAFELEAVLIEDTPIAAFAEIETEVVEPGGQVTLFPTAVVSSVEVSGQELRGSAAATYAWASGVVTVTETGHNRASGAAVHLAFTGTAPADGVYVIASVTGADTWTVAAAGGPGSGSVTVRSVLGGATGFTAAGPETEARHLAVDLVFPRGLFAATGGTLGDRSATVRFEAQRIDDAGDPLAAWTLLGEETVTDRTTTPVRRSFRYPAPVPGRYRVRAWRVDAKVEDSAGHEVIWAGLRAYLTEPEDYGDVTLLAVRARASNNLSLQASRRIAVVCTRKLPVWDGTSWSAPVATRSIAWAIADAARNAAYGAGLADASIDLAALLALDAVWSARGDRFDGRFDQAQAWWDAAQLIAQAGRARLYLQGGVLRVVRDAQVAVPVAMFSMRNIVRGSFSLDFVLPSDATADRVDVGYFDAGTWSPRRVTAALPGSAGTKPARIEVFGVTDRDHAWREGMYRAASNRWRRQIVRFSTEMEGFLPAIGDAILVNHDVPEWGRHAEAVAWDAATRTLRVTEPLEVGEGAHFVQLRRPDGSPSGPWRVTQGADARTLILDEDPDITPYTGGEMERTHVIFGPSNGFGATARVVRVTPRGPVEVEIEAVIEDDRVHTADRTGGPVAVRPPRLPRRPAQPVVTQLVARVMPGDATRVLLTWAPAPGAEVYQVEMAEGEDVAGDVSWTRLADTSAAGIAVPLLHANRTLVRVRGVGVAAGPWAATAVGTILAPFWTADGNAFWFGDAAPFWGRHA